MDEHGRDGVLFAERDPAASRADAAADFPVFGELQMRDFEASTRPMRIFDRGTLKYLAVNDAALALYGYSRAEFLALKLTDTRHPGEHPRLFTSESRPTRSIAHWAARRHVTKSGAVLEVETITQNVLFKGRKARLSLTIDVTERKHHELALRRAAALAGLLESLARTANEAVTPEAAMTACLELVCAYGGWALGHVAFYDEGATPGMPLRSVWHVADRERFAGFIRFSESRVPNPSGSILSRVLYEQVAVWIEDM